MAGSPCSFDNLVEDGNRGEFKPEKQPLGLNLALGLLKECGGPMDVVSGLSLLEDTRTPLVSWFFVVLCGSLSLQLSACHFFAEEDALERSGVKACGRQRVQAEMVVCGMVGRSCSLESCLMADQRRAFTRFLSKLPDLLTWALF